MTVGEELKAVEGRGLRRIGDLVLRGFTCNAPVEARDCVGLDEGGVFGGSRGKVREGSLGGVFGSMARVVSRLGAQTCSSVADSHQWVLYLSDSASSD